MEKTRLAIALTLFAIFGGGGFAVLTWNVWVAMFLWLAALVSLFWGVWPHIIKKLTKSTARIEVVKAFVCGTKNETTSGNVNLSHFCVKVELVLRVNKPNCHLSWIRLNISKESLDSVKSVPPMNDNIQYSEQVYELTFDVPVKTFLKARCSEGSFRADRTEPEAQIYVKVGGEDVYSPVFKIWSEQEMAKQVLTKKEFHEILDKASQPKKKPKSDQEKS